MRASYDAQHRAFNSLARSVDSLPVHIVPHMQHATSADWWLCGHVASCKALHTLPQTVTINNLVSDKNSRATDHSEYVDNPKFGFFPYTGYTKLLTVNGYTKVLRPSPSHSTTSHPTPSGPFPSLPFPFLPLPSQPFPFPFPFPPPPFLPSLSRSDRAPNLHRMRVCLREGSGPHMRSSTTVCKHSVIFNTCCACSPG